MSEHKDYKEEWKESTEKLWEATRKTFQSATHRATQYKDIVQKKIDMASLHKKINTAHTDLGKFIDDARTAGKKNILKDETVTAVYQRLDDLKEEAAILEEEIQSLRNDDQAPAAQEQAAPKEEPTEKEEKEKPAE